VNRLHQDYRRVGLCAVSLALLLACCPLARSEQITLVNGRVITGKIVAQDERHVVVEVPHGQVHIDRFRVASIAEDPDAPVAPVVSSPPDSTTAEAPELPSQKPAQEDLTQPDDPSKKEDPPPATDEQQVAKNIATVLGDDPVEGGRAALRLIEAGGAHVDDLMKSIQTADSPEAAARLIALLGHTGDPSVADRLVELAEKEDAPPEVRSAVALALANLGDDRSNEQLASLVESADPELRQLGAAGLGRVESPSAETIATLARCLGDSDQWTRLTASNSLLGIVEANPTDEIKDKLVAMLRSGDTQSRVGVATTLFQVQHPAGLRYLVDLSKDVLAADRLAAVRALKNCRVPGSSDALLERLKDEEPAVRRAAAEALRWFKRPDLVERIKPLLKDPDPSVRRAARATINRLRAT